MVPGRFPLHKEGFAHASLPEGAKDSPRIPKSKPSASGFDLDKEEGADEYAAWGSAASGMQLASSDAAVPEGVMTQLWFA